MRCPQGSIRCAQGRIRCPVLETRDGQQAPGSLFPVQRRRRHHLRGDPEFCGRLRQPVSENARAMVTDFSNLNTVVPIEWHLFPPSPPSQLPAPQPTSPSTSKVYVVWALMSIDWSVLTCIAVTIKLTMIYGTTWNSKRSRTKYLPKERSNRTAGKDRSENEFQCSRQSI